MLLAQNLRFLMNSRGLTAPDLADRLGRSQSVVYGWLRGDHKPARTTLKKLAECFEVPVQSLLEADLESLAQERPQGSRGGLTDPFRIVRRLLHLMRLSEPEEVKDFGPVVVLTGRAKQIFDELRSLEATLHALESEQNQRDLNRREERRAGEPSLQSSSRAEEPRDITQDAGSAFNPG